MIKVRYEFNVKHNGIELYFSSKPDAGVLLQLKSNGWRWHRAKECWYNIKNDENIKAANLLCRRFGDKKIATFANCSRTNEYIESDFDPDEWDMESLLFREGYTVSQKEGLNAKTRQMILAEVISNKLMTAKQVVQHISGQVRLREKNSNYDIACRKWNEDIDFIKKNYL